MTERIYKATAYEKYEGTPHIFEAFKQNIEGAAPFVIMLDGSFLATAENGTDIADEVESTRKWFGWCKVNPMFG